MKTLKEVLKTQNKTVATALRKYVLDTDLLKEVESRTDKHYAINEEFEVLRENKIYYIRVKEVNVSCSENKKSHLRIEVDTDLKEINKKEVDTEKLKKQLEDVNLWIAKNEKFFKGSDLLYKNKMKKIRLESKLNN